VSSDLLPAMVKLEIIMLSLCDIFKEYLKYLNRLYDITWFGAVYA
jgi:hypothetical protein